jgi:hypothetical protein
MLREAFGDAGWSAHVAFEARGIEPARHDLIVLPGSSRLVLGLGPMLARRCGRTPMVVAWQLEPLPPPGVSEEGERIGLRVAAWDWRRLPLPVRRVGEALVPFRTRVLRAIHRRLARPYARVVGGLPGQDGWLRFDAENLFTTMAEWRWLRQAWSQGRLDRVFASVEPRVGFLRGRGVPAELLPLGHAPAWGRDLGLDRDVDVLFLGPLDQRGPRGDLLRTLDEQLEWRGVRLTCVPRAFGHERDVWLSRARIMLAPLRIPHDMAGMRVMLGMAGGALVVAEACPGTGAFRPGEHFVMAPAEELAATIVHYLEHDDERRRIAGQGQRFLVREWTMRHAVEALLNSLPKLDLP